jgi:hypothetical protein
MLRLLRFRTLLAAAAILLAMGAGYHALHTTQGLVGAVNDAPLAAAEFRAPIADLEAHLFSAGPLTMEERIVLAQAFVDVQKALDARGGTHLAQYSAREVRTLAGMSRGLGKLGGADLQRVRHNWMRVRANTFDDASWFRFSEADPVATPEETRVPPSATDRATIEELKASLDRIDYAIGRGEREADRLGEPEPSGTADGYVLGAWRDWSGEWRAEIERIRSRLPEAPESSTPSGLRYGWDVTSRALDELYAVPGASAQGGRPPYRVEWTRRFQNARRNVKSARDWIAQAKLGRAI